MCTGVDEHKHMSAPGLSPGWLDGATESVPWSDGTTANTSGTNSDISTSRVHFVGATLPNGN